MTGMGIGTFTNLGSTQFGGTSVDVPAYEGFVEPTGNGLMDLLQESSMETYQLQAALYVADVVHEQATLESAQQAEAVFESVVKDTLAKLKKIFMDMWAKVKAWFASVIQRLKLLFQSGEKFISANKKQLEEKNVLGFTYKGFKWDLDAAENKVAHFATAAGKEVEKNLTAIAHPQNAGKELEPLEDAKEKIFRGLGVDDITELKKEIWLAARSGEETADEIKDFAANSKSELIDMVKNASKSIKSVEKVKREIDNDFNAVIKELDTAAKDIAKAEGEDKEKAQSVNVINRSAKVVQFIMTITSASSAALIDAINDSSRAATSTLKKYLTYKPAKESYDGGTDEEFALESMSILDRAVKLV